MSRAVRDGLPGPLVISGEPGAGRTTLLRHILDDIDRDSHFVVRIMPAGDRPFAALRPHLPADRPAHAALPATIQTVAAEIAIRANGLRLLVAVDDAHLVDHASMLVLRTLARQAGALLVLTRSDPADPGRGPDPTDCLRYEPSLETLHLPSLTPPQVGTLLRMAAGAPVHGATAAAVHAATAGNPRRLHDMVVAGCLVDRLVPDGGLLRLSEAGPSGTALPERADVPRIVAAVRDSWLDLDVDRTDELCRLAELCGAGDQVAGIRAIVLLLTDRATHGMRCLDALPEEAVARAPRLALTRAMLLAFGLGRVGAADELLLRAAQDSLVRGRLLAYRAWLRAVTDGHVDQGVVERAVEQRDREARLFGHAAAAAGAVAASRATTAVGHLRRALAAAEGCRETVPWMRPYLTARLIEALSLAGRRTEATATATEFESGGHGSEWDLAAKLTALVNDRRPAIEDRSGVQAA